MSSHQIILGKDSTGEPIKINWIQCIQLVCAAMNMKFESSGAIKCFVKQCDKD
jgi:hypothetical protein